VKAVIGSILVAFAFTFLMAGRPLESSPAMELLHQTYDDQKFSVYRKSVLKTAVAVAESDEFRPLFKHTNRLEQFKTKANEKLSTELEAALTNGGYEKLIGTQGKGSSINVFAKSASGDSKLRNLVAIISDSLQLQVFELNGTIEMKDINGLRDLENLQTLLQNRDIFK